MIVSNLSGLPYAIDMWSLGSIAYYMLTNRIFLGEFVLYNYGTGNQEGPCPLSLFSDLENHAKRERFRC